MGRPAQFSSEDEFVGYLQTITVGVGDDAAVVDFPSAKLVVTTDSLVEHIHFRASWVSPKFLGQKAALTNISDMSAMGAIPRYALISLILSNKFFEKSFLKGLYKGLDVEFRPIGVSIIGGNISKGDVLSISVTLLGSLDGDPLTRSGAKPGDSMFVTGSLGKAAAELHRLMAGKAKRARFLPPNRLAFAQALASHNLVTACMDISDGLYLDLYRMTKASRVGAVLYKTFAAGGEDYELLFTAKKGSFKELEDLAKNLDTPLFTIGEIVPKREGLTMITKEGKRVAVEPQGWDHTRA